MRQLSRYRLGRLIPLLAFLALQVADLMTPLHAAPAEARALFATLDVDQIVICTPDGPQTVDRDDLTPGITSHCPKCVAGNMAALLPDSLTGLEAVEWVLQSATLRALPPIHDVPRTAAFQSRAPPSVVI